MGCYEDELGEGLAGWLCTQALESIIWVYILALPNTLAKLLGSTI